MAQRETHHNVAPVLQQYVPQNDIVAKSPIFVARIFWNNIPVSTRNIDDHGKFKNVIRTMVKNEYMAEEKARLSAGLFKVL